MRYQGSELPVLHRMFIGRVPPTPHAADAAWSEWVPLMTQQAQMGNPNSPHVLKEMTVWPGGRDFRASSEEVAQAQEHNKLAESEKQYTLFTSGSCVVQNHRMWKAVVWSASHGPN